VTVRAFWVVAALLVALGMALVSPPPAHASEYSIERIAIQAEVAPDGSMLVTEERTHDFDGDFTFVYWQIDTSAAEGIEVLGVTGPEGAYALTEDPEAPDSRPAGTYQVTRIGTSTEIRAYFRASDTEHTLTLDYRILGAAKRWNDTAELYWQFIGAEHEVAMHDVSVHVVLPPGSAGDVRAWAHGPLTGLVQPNADGTVDLTVDTVPGGVFVEGRIAFPAAALASAPVIDTARLQTILDEEAARAEEANAERTKARILTWGLLGLVGVFALVAFVLTLRHWLRHGKEYKPQFEAEYYRERPADLTPAQVSALLNMGPASLEAVTATLMDLIDRGIVRIERMQVETKALFGLISNMEDTYRLTRVPDAEAGLLMSERMLLRVLFSTAGTGDGFTMEGLKGAVKQGDTADAWRKGIAEFKEQAATEIEQLGLLEEKGYAAKGAFIFLAAIVFFSGWVPLVMTGSGLALVLTVPAAIAIGILGATMARRSPEAAELAAQYEAVRRYLKDFGRMQEKPPDSVVLWRHFLTLAVVFGIADQVIKQLQVSAPDVVRDPTMGTVLWMTMPDRSGVTPMSALSSGFTSIASVAASHSSSAPGGGGGFSGGGGGGGGGGGSGAG